MAKRRVEDIVNDESMNKKGINREKVSLFHLDNSPIIIFHSSHKN